MQELYYWEALNQALKEEMNRDPLVFCMGEGIGQRGGSFKVTTGLWEEFGSERIMDTPLSEASFTGAGVGAAIIGTRPVVEIMFIDFTALILDQIVNQAAKYNFMSGGKGKVPLVLRTQGGCGNGIAAQHSQSLESWYYHIPGLKVVMPSTPADAKGLLKTSIRDDDPVIFIEHKRLYQTKGPVPDGEYTIPLGNADIKRTGKDVTIVTYSLMTLRCLEAAEQLEQEGIDAEIIDLRTIYPMDKEVILTSVKKTNRLVIVHEACCRGGVGGDIAGFVAENGFDYLDAPILRICGKNTPIPYNQNLEDVCVPQVKDIVDGVKKVMKYL